MGYADSAQFLSPEFELRIRSRLNGSGKFRVLPDSYKNLISSVTLTETVDGASQLNISAQALDPMGIGRDPMSYRFINEQIMFLGDEIELWAGYGKSLMPKGRFVVKTHDIVYGPDGVTIDIESFDKLTRFMDHTQARIYQGLKKHTDVLKDLMKKEYPSLGFIYDNSPKDRKGDRFKEIGTTDLWWIKQMALADGFSPPRMMTNDQWNWLYDHTPVGSSEQALVSSLSIEDFTEDNLVYAPTTTLTQFIQPLILWYNPRDGKDSDWSTFNPTFSTEGIPTAIEAYGTVHDPSSAFNNRVVKVVIELTPSGISDPVITDNFDDDWTKQSKIRKTTSDGNTIKMWSLGDGRVTYETGGKYTFTNKKGKSQTGKSEKEVREIINCEGVTVNTTQDVVEWAKNWLKVRSASYLIASGTLQNVPKIERIGPAQVHFVAGVAPLHEGAYVVLDATHRWDSSGHSVSVNMQKAIEKEDFLKNVKVESR